MVQIKDQQRNTKNYKYNYYADDENTDYEDWGAIADDFSCSSEMIDWKKPGNYPAAVSYLGAESTFDVTVTKSPVTEVRITQNPDQTSYDQYEYENISLKGMKYQITYSDGTSCSGTATENNASFEYNGTYYELLPQWKTTFNGIPKIGENAIILSVLGYRAEIDNITVNEDPVKSLEVTQNPEKMQYISRNDKADLYGAELSITYTDGSQDNIHCAEHTNSFEVTNPYGGSITARLFYDYDEDDAYRRYLNISYENASCTIALPELDLASLNPVKLEDNRSYPAVLTEETAYCIYSFTPSETSTYHFFSTGHGDSYVELYQGNTKIDENDDGDEDNNFKLSSKLKKDTVYYFIVTTYSSGEKGDFNCYFSSTVSSLSDLEITDMKITKVPRDTWYDFETPAQIWDESLLQNTEYEITYSNGWKRTEKITSHENSIEINGTTLSAKWENTLTDEDGDTYVDTNKDNAILYTYGEKEFRFPVTFHVPTPVSSISITQHPWENWKPYEYQIKEEAWPAGMVSVKVQYKDGKEENITWNTEDDIYYYHNGYAVKITLKDYDNIQTGTQNSLVFSYMGSSAEIPITITENPVRSIQLLQPPEKTEVYPFELYDDYFIDLYGIKIQINYKDGKKQIVESSEHSYKIAVPDTEGYGGTLASYLRYDEDTDFPTTLSVNYMGFKSDLLTYTVKTFTAENSAPLTENEEKQVILNEQSPYQIFSFTPSEAGNYQFSCEQDEYKCDNTISIYNASGQQLSYTWNRRLDYEMIENRQYYIVLRPELSAEQKLICTITRQSEVPKEDISKVNLSLNDPTAGNDLADIADKEYKQYYIAGYQWLNDENNDRIADYGTAHRLMVVYTQCKITIPQVNGYTLDESQNAVPGKTDYGKNYRFRYVKNADNTSDTRMIVKANDTVLTPDKDGYYIIERVTENIIVTTKQEGLSAGADESKLALHNKSEDIFDVLIGKQNTRLADNKDGEKALPSLESYINGSDQFFFGWYQDKDTALNGKGTRFTSLSILTDPLYDLYAKWERGIFSYILNNKPINCKILSIDEANKTKIQIGAAADQPAKTLSSADFKRNARAAENDGILEIPEKIDWSSNEELKALGVEFSECSITSIAENTFAGDNEIKQIKLPETLENIGANAFADCTGLEEISIPASVDTIPECAFQGCTSLARVHLAEGVSRIEAGAFDGCTNLQVVVLPDTLESVEESAFTSCDNLNIICSDARKESDVITAIQETTKANITTIDISLDYDGDEKQFSCGGPAQTFTATVRVNGQADAERKISWEYPDTSAYTFQESPDKKSLTVTPVRATTDADRIIIRAVDEASKKSRSIRLTTKDNEPVIEKDNQIITASDIKKTYGDDSFKIAASTNGDGKLSYESKNPKVISVDSASGMATIISAGTADLTIKASETEKYQAASKTIKVTVNKATVKISKKSYQKVYGDKPFKLGVSAKDTVTYTTSNAKAAVVKNGTVTIKACGTAKIYVSVKSANYVNTPQTITIHVVPKKAVIKKLTSKKAGQLTVTWKKQAEASGYVIEYSTDKKFKKGVKTINIGKNKTTSTTIKKKLSKGKKYYVRVKAYTKIDKKKVCGSASKVLNRKVKKK